MGLPESRPNTSRRERAWKALEEELGATIRSTSDLGGIWASAFDAYEGELEEEEDAIELTLGPERIAQRFHAVYEELAPVYGWKTQGRSAVAWSELPAANKRLMVKVVTRLIHEGTLPAGAMP